MVKALSFLVLISFLLAVPSWAMEDGFPSGQKIQTDHFILDLAPGVDEAELVMRLGIGPQHKVLFGQSLKGATFSGDDLGKLLDALFVWSCGVLDMQLYSYKGKIKVAATHAQLKDVYRKLYGSESYSDKGFYIYDLNTIYIASEDFSKEILGHEIGHAIASNFFVVQPPAKVQEVLAGYIEYQLRKISKGN